MSRQHYYINTEVEVDIFDEMTEEELAELLSDDVLRKELCKRDVKELYKPTGAELLNGAILSLPKFKAKDIICDILGISHTSTKDDITNTINELL